MQQQPMHMNPQMQQPVPAQPQVQAPTQGMMPNNGMMQQNQMPMNSMNSTHDQSMMGMPNGGQNMGYGNNNMQQGNYQGQGEFAMNSGMASNFSGNVMNP